MDDHVTTSTSATQTLITAAFMHPVITLLARMTAPVLKDFKVMDFSVTTSTNVK